MEQIQGYKLIKQIGKGGMASVFQGVQISLDRPVAIKILSKKLAKHSSILERFKRESLIIARLSHSNIIHVIDRGVSSKGMPYFIMEYVEGTDLEIAMKSGKLNHNRKIDLVIQICKALSYAHKNGVIHRDIKPANVLIDKEGNAKVLDFGIAQFYDEGNIDFQQTQPGTVMGTLAYMSPEQQVSSDGVTALSDIYSLGVIMYELFTGTKPTGRFQLPSEIADDIPESLQSTIMSCLESDPFTRPSSADEIKHRLLKLSRGAHLKTDQKQRANLGITSIKKKFALLDIIKEKAQGSVYLYENKDNNILMVIKRMPNTSSGFTEAKLLTSLDHKNIAKILGSSKNERFFIIVMAYLSGGCLKDRLIKPHSVDLFIKEARQICEGLSFAHRNKIIHGNLRPSNILFTESGEIKITDFGLDEHYSSKSDEKNWFNIGNEPKSVRADILATGILFHQMLTGMIPQIENNAFVPSKKFKTLPEKLQHTIKRMLAMDPEKRHSNFDQVLKGIESLTVYGMDTIEMDSPFHTIQTETDEKPPPPPQSDRLKEISKKTIMPTLFLLLLLIISAVTYLIQTENSSFYMDFLKDLIRIITKR